MSRTVLIATLIVTISEHGCHAVVTPPVELTEHSDHFHVTPYADHLHGIFVSDAGVKSCGGQGTLLARYHSVCHSSPDTVKPFPCVLPSDQSVPGQVVFAPRESSTRLRVRVTTTTTDGAVNWSFEKPLPTIGLMAGRNYVLSVGGAALTTLKGKMFSSKLEIFREADNQVEICSLAEYLVT